MNPLIYLADVVDDPIPDAVEKVTVGQIIVVVVFIVTIISGLLLLFKSVKPFFTGIKFFLEDWNGVPQRSGVERRPGVMERLDLLEEIKHEIKPNRGSSLADEIYRIGDRVGTQHGRLHSRSPAEHRDDEYEQARDAEQVDSEPGRP